jgi:hypothetical protein
MPGPQDFTRFRDRSRDMDSDSDSDDAMSEDSQYRFDGSHADDSDEDMRVRSPSPTPSTVSLTGSFLERAFRMEHGRKFNAFSDIYCLPADREELDRHGMLP